MLVLSPLEPSASPASIEVARVASEGEALAGILLMLSHELGNLLCPPTLLVDSLQDEVEGSDAEEVRDSLRSLQLAAELAAMMRELGQLIGERRAGREHSDLIGDFTTRIAKRFPNSQLAANFQHKLTGAQGK